MRSDSEADALRYNVPFDVLVIITGYIAVVKHLKVKQNIVKSGLFDHIVIYCHSLRLMLPQLPYNAIVIRPKNKAWAFVPYAPLLSQSMCNVYRLPCHKAQ